MFCCCKPWPNKQKRKTKYIGHERVDHERQAMQVLVLIVNALGTRDRKIVNNTCRAQQRSPRDWGMVETGALVTMVEWAQYDPTRSAGR